MELKKIDSKKNLKDKTELMLFLLFVCFTLCLSVGYAALNSDLKISGEANFRVESDIRITNVSLYETTNLGLENYTSKYSKYTVTIGADLKQVNSTISYKVKVQNSGTVSMWIDSIEETKNNDNIEYVLEGIGLKELINPGEEKEFTLKIKYKDSITTLPYNTNIDTILKFNFIKPESVLSHTSYSENQGVNDKFLTGPITRGSIESITFMPTLDVVEDAIGSWDASYDKNETVIASYKDSDGNGLYELYIGGIGVVYANSNQDSLFYNLTKLKKITFNGYFDTSKTKTMYSMFRNCYLLESVDTNMFDTSNVTNMGGMFINCQKLKNIDVSSFDTSNVTNMLGMFSDCRSLESIDVSNFNTSNVTAVANNYGGMFMNCYELKTLDLSSFDTSKITSFARMFTGCSKLTSLNISNFDTSNVTDMSNMFNGCSSLLKIDTSGFNTKKVTSMMGMFYECKKVTNLDVSGFNTSNVTEMTNMFGNCSSLISLDVSKFNTSKVYKFGQMFLGCSSLTSLNVSNFDTSGSVDIHSMFNGCSKLTYIDVSNFNTSKVTNMSSMFNNCKSLISNYEFDSSSKKYNYTFDISNFNTSNVTDMSYMFYGCSSIKSLDFSSFDTSKVTSMKGMFEGCANLINESESGGTIGNDFWMVYSLDLSKFVTNENTDLSRMFAYCKSLNVIGLTSMVFANESKAQNMFYSTSNLTNVLVYKDYTNVVSSIVKNSGSSATVSGLNVKGATY